MSGLQSGEGHVMTDSVVWAQYINVTDRQTDTQTHRQPRHYALRSGGKNQNPTVNKRPTICDIQSTGGGTKGLVPGGGTDEIFAGKNYTKEYQRPFAAEYGGE